MNVAAKPLVRMLTDLVRLPSQNPGADEAAVAAYVAARCRGLGLEVTTPEVFPRRPNVVARLRGDRPGPVVVLNTHLDTVPAGERWSDDAFGGTVRDGRVSGLGASDAKGQVVAMLGAIESLVASGRPRAAEVLFTGVVDEELGSQGARDLVKGLRADYAIVGEPTRLRVAVAHRGSVRPRIVRGQASAVHAGIRRARLRPDPKAAHSSTPRLGINAIFKMRKVLEALEAYVEGLDARRHPLIGPPSGAVTLIRGGLKESAVPDRCEIVLDRRMVPGEPQDGVVADIEAILHRLAAAEPELRVGIEGYLPTSGPPSETPRDARLVRLAEESVRAVTGQAPEVYGAGFGCDMTHFRGIGAEAVILGPGDIDRAHRPDEYIGIDELLDGTKAYANLLERLLTTA